MTVLLDRDHFSLMTGDDRALQIEIVGLFRAQAMNWRTALEPASPAPEWRTIIHTLKGSARGIGLKALAEACAHAESGAPGELDAIEDRLNGVRIAVEEALSALSDAGFAA